MIYEKIPHEVKPMTRLLAVLTLVAALLGLNVTPSLARPAPRRTHWAMYAGTKLPRPKANVKRRNRARVLREKRRQKRH